MTVLALAVTGRGLVDPMEPVIRADDDGLLRGRAAFETLRVYAGRPFRLEAHLDRLTASAASIGLPSVERRRLQVLVGLVLPKASGGDASLRLVWTAGPSGGVPSAFALLSSVPDWIDAARERGATAVSLLGVRASAPWLLPGVKSTSYAVNMAAEAEARRRGVEEAFFVDADGIVLEGTVTNVWWRVGDTLYTPSLDLGILAGRDARDADASSHRRAATGSRRARTRSSSCSPPRRRSRRRPCASSCRSSRSTASRSARGPAVDTAAGGAPRARS